MKALGPTSETPQPPALYGFCTLRQTKALRPTMNPQALKDIFDSWFDLQDQAEIRDLDEWVNDLFHYMRASTSDDELSDEMSDWAGLKLVDESWF